MSWPDGKCQVRSVERTVFKPMLGMGYPFCTRPAGHKGDHVSATPDYLIPRDVAHAEITVKPMIRWSAA